MHPLTKSHTLRWLLSVHFFHSLWRTFQGLWTAEMRVKASNDLYGQTWGTLMIQDSSGLRAQPKGRQLLKAWPESLARRLDESAIILRPEWKIRVHADYNFQSLTSWTLGMNCRQKQLFSSGSAQTPFWAPVASSSLAWKSNSWHHITMIWQITKVSLCHYAETKMDSYEHVLLGVGVNLILVELRAN